MEPTQRARPGRAGRDAGSERAGVVLVIERESGVAALERLYLVREGYVVHVESDPGRAAESARRIRPDVVVLDLAAGGHAEVAAAARPAPVVCVTTDASASPGPYTVPRPFSPRVLVATVGQALRGRESVPHDDLLRAGDVVLDQAAHRVLVGGLPKALTATEFDLLAFLMGRPGRVYTREQLLAAVWGASDSAGTRTVDVHIAQLRAKLGAASPIRTVRGVGYAVDA